MSWFTDFYSFFNPLIVDIYLFASTCFVFGVVKPFMTSRQDNGTVVMVLHIIITMFSVLTLIANISPYCKKMSVPWLIHDPDSPQILLLSAINLKSKKYKDFLNILLS